MLRRTLVLSASILLTTMILVSNLVAAETRLALIVTNLRYPAEIGALTNSYKDGELVAAALENVGFEKSNIIVVKDADHPTLKMAIADFIERIDKAGKDTVVFFYYSGHGAAGPCLLWVKSGSRVAISRCPLLPQQQTFPNNRH